MTFRPRCILITTVLILGLSIQAPAAAENHRANNTNESYYNISKLPEKIFNRRPKHHESFFAISSDEVLYKLEQKQKITLIDVRNSEDFVRLHIPGSLNLPLHAVKAKAFLRSFEIVLINEGFHYSPLESECQKLRGQGFNVFILDGGLPAWMHKGSPLAGDLYALEEMQAVSPQVFFREKDYKTTLVIDISPVQTEINRQLMPYSRHLPVSADTDGWVRKFKRIIADHKNQPFLSVVVFNETGDGYGGASKILTGNGVNVFCLQGGVAGYKRYLENLVLSWLPRDNRIKTNRNCRTCIKEIEENIIMEVRE